jgi:RimJ/RimL family protein N-acetyltransferase
MEHLLVVARNRGVRRIWLICLAENARMRRIARKLGASVQMEHGEATAVLRPLPPNPATILVEAWDDGQQLARMMADLNRGLVEAARPWLRLAA